MSKLQTLFILFLFTVILQGEDGTQGIGLEIGDQGTGLLVNRVWKFNQDFQWILYGSIFDVKGEDQMMVWDYYSQQYRSVGDKYLMIISLFGGGKYFPFAGQIANNFSPYITARAGPVLTLDAGDSEKFITRWKNSKGLWTAGGYAGVGVDFLMHGGLVASAGVGMGFLPMNGYVKGETNYNGFIIHIAFNRRQ